jgi:hypothetical protein
MDIKEIVWEDVSWIGTGRGGEMLARCWKAIGEVLTGCWRAIG